MPQKTGSAPPIPESDEALRTQIATSLRAARARTGLSGSQVADLLAKQGLDVTPATLERWESTGLLRVDSAVHLATAYGTTLDLLAGRRAFQQRHAASKLPPPDRSAW